jgi:cholesterol transport system auxiliary component
MTPQRLRLLGTVSLAPLLACLSASLPKATAPDLYVLDPPLPRGAAPADEAPAPIVLAPVRASPSLEGSGMVYVRREHEVGYFARSAWVEPPARMLAPLLARALEIGGTFQVVRDAASAAARLRLETDVVRLQQEFTERPSLVRLVLHVRLIDATARRVLGDKEIEVVEPAPRDDAYGGVLAANAAAARALADVAAACAGWARAAPR